MLKKKKIVRNFYIASNKELNINLFNMLSKEEPNAIIVLNLSSTVDLSSDLLRQLNTKINISIPNGHGEYSKACRYTRNEIIKIIEQMEKIESKIHPMWSDIQKLVYVYDKLKRDIIYDPKYKEKTSREIRSLRGLITKKSVCLGYALILQEIMARNNIDCKVACGAIDLDWNSLHAWNIANIDGKYYPLDLTWDSTNYRKGEEDTFEWFARDVVEFADSHFPDDSQEIQDYKETLSEIKPEIIKEIYSQISRTKNKEYSSTTYKFKRSDGSRFLLAQVGYKKGYGEIFYRYFYSEISEDGIAGEPIILYTPININKLIYYIDWNKENKEERHAIINILFSKENIEDSIFKGENYIGSICKDDSYEIVSNYREISKKFIDSNLCYSRQFSVKREDGTSFVVEEKKQILTRNLGLSLNIYDIFEIVEEEGEHVVKQAKIFTERDLLEQVRENLNIIDRDLATANLEIISRLFGGYMGYYDRDGQQKITPEIFEFLTPYKRVDIDSLNIKNKEDESENNGVRER